MAFGVRVQLFLDLHEEQPVRTLDRRPHRRDFVFQQEPPVGLSQFCGFVLPGKSCCFCLPSPPVQQRDRDRIGSASHLADNCHSNTYHAIS